ncbi:hypothetical protein QWZ08_17325 [Ferruginibacter paludis]|uniref:hypothetical protein n=1 Tax=Ferruginibacter paludis TaxID=1310417 RepID=UPI0025B49988|nr:hypothetical protein [Ferruginibacter paludis]MDN3657417.1 hypothetical protein [Ferruginibacter paludis]
MKNIFTTQEILLMTNTEFSGREYSDKNENQPSKNNNQNKLAEACWNGLIPAMLPELFDDPCSKHRTMWQLAECNHLLYAHLGEDSATPDMEFTINPYVLMEEMNAN